MQEPNHSSLRELKARPEPETPAISLEKCVVKHSAYELYQMALPHIINSNARVQELISIEAKKQKVKTKKASEHYLL